MSARRSATEHGQSLVELALALPLLLLIMVGLLDVGRIFYAYITITNAAREAARYAATSPIEDTPIKQAAVDEAASSGFTISTSQVSVSKTGIGPGDSVTVTINVTYSLVTRYIFGGGAVPLRNSATMVILQGVGD